MSISLCGLDMPVALYSLIDMPSQPYPSRGCSLMYFTVLAHILSLLCPSEPPALPDSIRPASSAKPVNSLLSSGISSSPAASNAAAAPIMMPVLRRLRGSFTAVTAAEITETISTAAMHPSEWFRHRTIMLSTAVTAPAIISRPSA